MDLTLSERDRRWAEARKIMARHDVDAVVAYSDFGDQASLQRYLSNYRSAYDYQAVMLFRDEGCELVMTHAGGIPISQKLSWATAAFPMAVPESMAGHNAASHVLKKGPSVAGQMANRLQERAVKRLGVIGMEFFPSGWKETLEAAMPDLELIDVWTDFHAMRLVKSEDELAIIREACRISDIAWEQMPEIVRPGRKRYEVLADIEHILYSHGCEDSFNLCMSLPMLQGPLDRNPYSALPIEDDGVYLIEVSPRYLGYYGQQTGLVAIGAVPKEMRDAYDAVNRARDKALEIAKPGVDLIEMGAAIEAQLKRDGYESAFPSFGHAVGMELEDFHIDGSSLVLQEGMTFIFHPFAAGYPAIMRADTYVITNSGVERLTGGDITPLELS